MKVSVLCSSNSHPVYSVLALWQQRRKVEHEIEMVQTRRELTGGDLLFLISCNEIIDQSVRSRYRATLVIHASDLPAGRGWSPHIWQVLAGSNEITVSLLEAEDQVDSGAIWAQRKLCFAGHELYDEINQILFAAEIELMDWALDNFGSVVPKPQAAGPASYYRKRTPEDSRIDPQRPLAEQFELLRVSDPERFPAFVDFRGHRYRIVLDKLPNAKE